MTSSNTPDPKAESHPQKASAEQAIIEGRKQKAARLRERGENPFANDTVPKNGGTTFALGALRDSVVGARGEGGKYDETKVKELTLRGGAAGMFHVRGRILAIRVAGGLSFLRLRDGSGELQLLCDESKLGAEYKKLDDLDIGDLVETEGTLTASKRGELSLEPARIRMLTKAYRPLPEKWHGLQDVETRYRQRYVDLVANPDVAQVFRARSFIVRAVRKALDDASFLEVETPTMHTLIGGAVAKPFLTHHNTLGMDLFMRIAPELYLKRLLVGGLDRVYEIGRCYRNEGISTRHNPEFTMLEFYQAYATYEEIMDFTEVLIRSADRDLAAAMPESQKAWKEARPFTFDEPFARIPMAEAVKRGALLSEIPAWKDAVEKDGTGLVALLRGGFVDHMKEWSKTSPRAKKFDWGNLRKGFEKCDNDGERLFCLYEYLCEPFLADDYRSADGTKSLPVFVKDYPFETSPLARKNDLRPDLVDRFELFVHGRELCNAFSELNDPEDQAARFLEQVSKKEKGAEETMDYDEDYVRALEHGMPPAAGFGMGIDRLVMMLTNAASIRDVVFFPLLRKET